MDGEGEDEDYESIFTKENQKHRIVKYHEHGILRRKGENWVFESQSETQDFNTEGSDITLIDLLDDLSKEGYALVGVDGGDYILRNENKIEEIEGYWDTDEIKSI